ncbi:hypothetical protein PsYK624_002270 [Phanerochaete sordida]|uniref:MYND-type domain-containing protein n=1 Tax=Phanerochaete sordida TaxID=48140 RepID=A0A9P3FX16_9APHY|nr:hypothetical protein PsYK624_002270 [Phanerochaete sordida]
MSGVAAIPLEAWGVAEWQHALLYVVPRLNSYFPTSYIDGIARVEKAVVDNVFHLLERSLTAVRLGVAAGNAHDMIELALRLYAGVTVKQNEEQAIETLMRALRTPRASRSVRARALSLLASIHHARRIPNLERPGVWDLDALYRAAVCADEAAALGFTSPSVLAVGIEVERAGFRRRADCRLPQSAWRVEHFAALAELWRVVDRRKVAIWRAQTRRQAKLRRDPNAYVCAAPGCGVEGTHKAALARCSGRCAKPGKPAYCSKDCQKKDWRRHKAFCREGAPVDELAASMRQVVYEDIALINFADVDSYQPTFDVFKGSFNADGTVDPQPEAARKEYRIDIPDVHGGKDSKWVSSTIDPASLKQLRKFADEAKARRGL